MSATTRRKEACSTAHALWLPVSTTRPQKISINYSSLNGWTGQVQQVMIVPNDTVGSRFAIDSIRFLP
jgi:hypothetical protein